MTVEDSGDRALPVYTGPWLASSANGFTCPETSRLAVPCYFGRSTSLSGHFAGADAQDRRQKRIRVVVLGSGWGACSFLKAMKKSDAEVRSARCGICGVLGILVVPVMLSHVHPEFGFWT